MSVINGGDKLWFNYSESTLGERFMVIVVYSLEGFTTLAANAAAIKHRLSGSQPGRGASTGMLPILKDKMVFFRIQFCSLVFVIMHKDFFLSSLSDSSVIVSVWYNTG